MKERLLEIRAISKKKKPHFLKQDAHKIRTLSDNWRKPRGMHSKTRMKLRGYRSCPSVGWSSPKEVRGLTPEGYEVVLVANVGELENRKDTITIAGNVGVRKKVEILKKAKEKGIKVLNVKNVDKYIKDVEDMIAKKKAETQEKTAKKERAKEEAKKKAKEKDKTEAKAEEGDTDKDKRQKEEQKRVLEKK